LDDIRQYGRPLGTAAGCTGMRHYISYFSDPYVLRSPKKHPMEQDIKDQRITHIDTVRELWSKTYNTEGRPDWSHILPFYHQDIYFRDTIQEIRGIEDFTAMTERLTERSKDLKMNIVRAIMEDDTVFIEWEMTLTFKRNPSSVLYGSSRLTLDPEGKIIEQRDYYDLWGDIFDNIPRFGKAYRRFVKRKFG
jgi:limonene-1,2-epoxide hydrolase